ncbi:MAG: outer membrane beta-barrel protein [Desulfobulbaceae bacterium]|nr:outer membrane beta-barrel protein [Desulfobulbaceae bacterium]
MKKKIFIAMTCAIVMFASTALAGNLYVKADLGFNMLEDSDVTLTNRRTSISGTYEYDAGLFTSAAVGYDYGQFRVDGELGFSSNDVDRVGVRGQNIAVGDSSLHQLCFMANVYFDMENTSNLTPYAGLGLGFSSLIYEEGSDDWDDTGFAYQFSLGLAIEISKMVDLDLAYRYFGASAPTFEDSIGQALEVDYASHILMGGVKLNF